MRSCRTINAGNGFSPVTPGESPGIWRRCIFPLIACLVFLAVIGGCTSKKTHLQTYKAKPATVKKALPRMGYTIQAGAFSQPENAARLTEILKDKGIDATYFAAKTGLYKVRIGNFSAQIGRAHV